MHQYCMWDSSSAYERQIGAIKRQSQRSIRSVSNCRFLNWSNNELGQTSGDKSFVGKEDESTIRYHQRDGERTEIKLGIGE